MNQLNAQQPWAKVQVGLEHTPSGILRDIRCGLIQSKYMCVGGWYTRSVEGVGGCLFGAALMTQERTEFQKDHEEVKVLAENEWGKMFWESAITHYHRVYAEELNEMQPRLVEQIRAWGWDYDPDTYPINFLIAAYDMWGEQKTYRKIKTWQKTQFLPETQATVLNERGRNKLIDAIEAILHDRAFEVPDCPVDLFDGCLLVPREVVGA